MKSCRPLPNTGHRCLGVPKALSLTTEEWVKQRLGGYVRLSVEERRQAVTELAAEGQSNVAIAQVLGVDEGTIRGDRKSENSESDSKKARHSEASSENSESSPLDVVAGLAATKEVREAVEREEKREEIRQRRDRVREERTAQDLPNGKYRLIYADPPWRYAVAEALGERLAIQVPYQQPVASDGALILTKNATDTRWWQALAASATALCLPFGRLKGNHDHARGVAAVLRRAGRRVRSLV